MGPKEERSLRNKARVDYKKMQEGQSDEEQTELWREMDISLRRSPKVESYPLGASAEQFEQQQPIPVFRLNIAAEEQNRSQTKAESIDEEMERMRREMEELQAEEVRLRQNLDLEKMRKDLEVQRQKIRSLRGNKQSSVSYCDLGARPKVTSHSLSDPIQIISNKNKVEIGIDDLRKDDKLQSLVKQELRKLGLHEYLDSAVSSSCDSSDESADSCYDGKREKKKSSKRTSKKMSGINAKASDKVRYPQRWPHAHLQFEYVNKQVKFEDLDFKLFVAGELEIIAGDDISAMERAGRLDLLRKIVYYYNTYEFVGLKSFYAAWLREIELGKKSWSDDSQLIESAILSKYLLKNKTFSNISNTTTSNSRKEFSGNVEDRVWFCSDYQRNKCLHKNSHLVVIKGKQRHATHICASCWLKDKKRMEHPECSSCCPDLSN